MSTQDDLKAIPFLSSMLELYLHQQKGHIRLGYDQLGFYRLGNYIQGLFPGNVMQIIARTSVGKTTFALNLSEFFVKTGVTVLFITLEQRHFEIWKKMYSISTGNVLPFILPETWYDAMNTDEGNAFMELHNKHFWLIDVPGFALQDIEKAIDANMDDKIDLPKVVIIDQLSYIKNFEGMKAYEQTSRKALLLKEIAKRTELPIICLHQVNREGKEGSVEAEMFMARDSGAVEENCDYMLGLSLPALKPGLSKEDKEKLKKLMTVNIVKNRTGARGKFNMFVDYKTMRIHELSEITEDET